MPHVAMRTSNSPGPIDGTGTVSTRISLTPRYTTACIVAGIFESIGLSALESWVAIPFPDVTSFIEKFEHRLRDAVGSLPAIFAHPDECGPVPGPHNRKKDKPAELKLSVLGDKAVKIRQPGGQ